MATKTLINGTAYEIKGGKTLVNGTAYEIESGKTLVGGTAYEIVVGGCVITIISGRYTNGPHSVTILGETIDSGGTGMEEFDDGGSTSLRAVRIVPMGTKIAFRTKKNAIGGIHLNGKSVGTNTSDGFCVYEHTVQYNTEVSFDAMYRITITENP